MIRTTVSTTVDAPIEKVWNFMVDLRKMILDPSVIDVSWQPPLKTGSVATITFRQMRVNRTAKLEVIDMDPNRRAQDGDDGDGVQARRNLYHGAVGWWQDKAQRCRTDRNPWADEIDLPLPFLLYKKGSVEGNGANKEGPSNLKAKRDKLKMRVFE